ncbi:MAG: PAS domain-containing protein [Rhizobiales bacterium]|nr:PAS domain-containing protein [Hyphomicrobiales bacterium]
MAIPEGGIAMEQLGWEAGVIELINGFLFRCKADEAWTMMEMSSGIERVLGYPAHEIIGNRVRIYSSLVHPEDLPAVSAAVDQA